MSDLLLTCDQARRLLAGTGWLATRPPDFTAALLSAALVRHYGPGEPFNVAGDTEAGIWGVASGQAFGISAINAPSAPASFVVRPGDWAGTGPIFGHSRIGDCVARLPTSILLVPYHALKRLLAEHPAWWEHLGELNFRILRLYGAIAVDLQISNSRARIAAILLNAAGLRHDGADARSIAITQDELGTMANLSRHPTGEHLRAFARAGLVSMDYGQVVLHQPAALRAIADGG